MSSKILSENPTELELKVAQAFVDLESQADLKAELRPLQFKSIKEIDVNGGKSFSCFRSTTKFTSLQKSSN